MDKPTILFLHNNTRRISLRKASHHWLAAEAGFRSYAVNWRSVRCVDGGVRVRRGYEAVSQNRKRPLRGWELLKPQVIVHRKSIHGRSARLMARLADLVPGSLLSYHPSWKAISQKWTAEACFQASSGLEVERPTTYLLEKREILSDLREVGASKPLIFKPSTGSMCRGIWLSTPRTFDGIVRRVRASRWKRYVVQQLVENPLLYQGKKFDLRIYVLVTFHPLQIRIYRGGVARLAAREYDPDLPDGGLRSLTGCSYRKRRRVKIENLAIADLLDYLATLGWKVDDFWLRAQALIENVFGCLSEHPTLRRQDGFARRFYLGGLDLLMERQRDSYRLLFLETNYYPQLNSWGVSVDRSLQSVHRQWLEDLGRLCAIRH